MVLKKTVDWVKEKVKKEPATVMGLKVALKRTAELDLGEAAGWSVTMVASGLSGQQVQQLVEQINDRGTISVVVMERQDAKAEDDSKSG